MSSPAKPSRGPGFLFGVALGAIVGTGALIMAGGKKTDQLKAKLEDKFSQGLDALKQRYPDQTAEVETVLTKALEEARQKTNTVKATARTISHEADSLKKSFTQNLAEKRTFTRKGKKLSPDA